MDRGRLIRMRSRGCVLSLSARPTCLGFTCYGLGVRVWCSGFGVWGLGVGVQGLGFGAWELGFGVWLEGWGLGLGFRVSDSLE